MKRTGLLALASVLTAHTMGQIALKPNGNVAVQLHPKALNIEAKLAKGLATSTWTYLFQSYGGWWRGEADFLIKIPKGGVVTGFAYWYQGEKVIARVAAKDRAREIYQAIVSRQRDPALIELVGKDTFRVKIFPIEQNADLKVELKLAQALPDAGQGSTLTLPLRKLGKVDEATISVTSDRLVRTSFGTEGQSLKYESKVQAVPDLKFTEIRGPKALTGNFSAVKSGSEQGFFSLTLTPSQSLTNPTWKLEGPVYDVHRLALPGRTIVLAGRLREGASGQKLRAWVLGKGYRASADLPIQVVDDPNSAPIKLWAWAKIQDSKSPKEITELSIRHTVPSRYTSWIAIPTEERKRMAREIAQAEFRVSVERKAKELLRAGILSETGQQIVRQLNKRAAALGISPKEIWIDSLSEHTDQVAKRWQSALTARGEHDPRTRRLRRELNALDSIGAGSGYVAQYYRTEASKLAETVLQNRLTAKPPKNKRTIEMRFSKAARESAVPASQYLESAAYRDLNRLAGVLAKAERAGAPIPTEALRHLRRLESVSGVEPDTHMKMWRAGFAYDDHRKIQQRVEEEISMPQPDLATLMELGKQAKEASDRAAKNGSPGLQIYVPTTPLRALADELAGGAKSASDIAPSVARFNSFVQAVGAKESEYPFKGILENAYYGRLQQITGEELRPRRDHARLESIRAEVARLEPLIPSKRREELNKNLWTYDYGDTSWKLRDAYVKARHEGKPAEDLLAKLLAQDRLYPRQRYWSNIAYKKSIKWAELRAERLRTLTDLDDLDRQQPDPEVVAKKADLERRLKTIVARMGDPIVAIEAPNAREVWAILPGGTRLPMRKLPNSDRWEARFDIPPSAKDGDYQIPIYVDGQEVARMPLRVDNTAPDAAWTHENGLVRVTGDLHLVRVVGFTPAGDRVSFSMLEPGVFLGRVPVGTRIVATDRAHNRVEFIVDSDRGVARSTQSKHEPGTEEPWITDKTVSCLAFVKDHLLEGYTNRGIYSQESLLENRFLGPKQIVSLEDRAVTRWADGTVLIGQDPVSLSRPATAIATAKGALLVGHFGGFSLISERQSHIQGAFPDDLAGQVITAIYQQGETVWLGTQQRGLYAYNLATQSGSWHDERRGLTDDWITCIGENSSGQLVVGTFVGGAVVKDGDWKQVPGTEGACVTGIDRDWIATRQGVWFRLKRVSDLEATALAVRGNTAWIGTRDGTIALPQQP